jgi:hypothetical protein
MLADWQTAGAALGPTIDRSPALREIKPLAHSLSQLGETGMEAVTYLKLGMPPPREWRETSLAKVDEAAKPVAALEFVVIGGVKQLINTAADIKRQF